MKRYQFLLLSILLLFLPACHADSKKSGILLPAGQYAVSVSIGKTGARARFTLGESGDYELFFDDPTSPLFGYKESVSGDEYHSEFAGIRPDHETIPASARLFRDALRTLNGEQPEREEEQFENNILCRKRTFTFSGGNIAFLSEKETENPVLLEIQSGAFYLLIRFAVNISPESA